MLEHQTKALCLDNELAGTQSRYLNFDVGRVGAIPSPDQTQAWHSSTREVCALLSSLSFENAVRYANLTRLIGIGRRVVMSITRSWELSPEDRRDREKVNEAVRRDRESRQRT